MKRISILFVAFVLSISSVFSGNFFTDRFFEVKVDVPVQISNNALQLRDLFQEEVVIDLKKICDDLPEKGFLLSTTAATDVSLNINIPKAFSFGFSLGLDAYGDMNISKDLFNFLGYGNKLNEPINVDVTGKADMFAYSSFTCGVNLNRGYYKITATGFQSLIHALCSDTTITAFNNEDGKFGYKMDGNISIFSQAPLSKDVELKLEELLTFEKIGLDITACVGYDVSNDLSIEGVFRFPIKPSTLDYRTDMKYNMEFETSLDSENNDTNDETDNSGLNKETTGAKIDPIKVNRPMKFSISADFHPFGSILRYYGGIGVGITNPFCAQENRDVFFDYLVGARFSIFDILSVSASMARSNNVYINKVNLGLSIRFVELNAGVALEGTSLAQSFRGAGLGVFINGSVGF